MLPSLFAVSAMNYWWFYALLVLIILVIGVVAIVLSVNRARRRKKRCVECNDAVSEATPAAETAEATPATETAGATPAAETAEATPAAETAEATPSAETAEAAPATETAEAAPAAEIVEAAPAAETAEATPAAESAEATPAAETAEATLAAETAEATPAAETAPEASLSTESTAEAIPVAESTGRGKRVTGKYAFILVPDGYHYCLLANNGQLLYESVGYTTLDGAKSGIETFKRAVAGGKFQIRHDRGGRYSYVLDGKFYGEGYDTEASCQRAIESVKRFAATEIYADADISDEEIVAYQEAKKNLKNASSVAWERVEAEEEASEKMGKFMIDPEKKGASFTLIANNGKCLFTSRIYSDVKSALSAVESFKKAVYIGNFFITDDKFGNFRFALKGTGTNWYVGDSYATRDRCQDAIESVKHFVKTAEIVINKEEGHKSAETSVNEN